MRWGIIGHAPRHNYGCAQQFFENMKSTPTEHPLVLYSAYTWPGVVKIPSPDRFQRALSVNNYVFLSGIRVAQEAGFDRYLYLEHDCRVGCAHWDRIVIDEYESQCGDAIVAGSVVLAGNHHPGAEEQSKFPSIMRWPQVRGQDVTFVMGALGIYHTSEVARLFSLQHSEPARLSELMPVWDLELGYRIKQWYGLNTLNKQIGVLRSIYSGWGERTNTEAERRQALASGKYAAVHQIKSNWKP